MGTVSWTAGTGPLAPFADGFRQELLGLDHPPESVKHYLVLMGQLDGWLMVEGRGVVELTAAVAEEFLVTRRARGQRRVPTLASLVPLFEYLKKQGAVRAEEPKPPTAREVLLAGYHHHLVHERGLTPSTVVRYERFARRFLAQRALRTGTDIGTEKLASPEISAFMLETGSRLVVESAKREAADLRSLLRFFYLRGVLETDLGTAMPPVATWRGTRLPPSLSAAHVDALLASCDRSTASGRRDYAVLALLARLGLRSGEVAALQLGDVDWRAGEVAVRGKARRQDRLPLPVEVGEALADYLRRGRPRSGCRQVILTLYAPFRPIHPSSITNIVYRACRRAGMPRVGGHRLRHALATEMLRRGGNLMEIAQVLRQSDPGTTSGYAKVDRVALRCRAVLAGSGAMRALAQRAEQYLRLRRALGHQLDDAHRLLPRFVAFLDSLGASRITVEAALVWVRRPDADPASSVWSRRMTVVRGFARHMSGIDPDTEIPPLGLVTFQRHWRTPFIYSSDDVETLMAAVTRLVPTPLRAATFQTMIGLLAATGMRVGETIALDRNDIDWAEAVIVVRSSKFNKSRELPLDSSTINALACYAQIRDRCVPRPASPTFFVSGKGTPIIYSDFGAKFRALVAKTGIGADSPAVPRVHDLRHSFAVHTLVRWYQAGEDVAALLPRLSTYLGHLTPGYTYWYLSAAPELLALAAGRLQDADRRRAR